MNESYCLLCVKEWLFILLIYYYNVSNNML